MTPTFDHFDKLSDREFIKGRYARLRDDAGNEYGRGNPPIPAGTVIKCDFCCDSGLYALADIDGILTKVLIPLADLIKVEIAPFPPPPPDTGTPPGETP
jgi:hypothetical protein